MLRIKNWHQFQHFKDRRPPWIKLHRDILDQRDINTISDGSFRVLIGLWLLASEDKDMEGSLPCPDDIAFRLRMDKSKVINALQELDPFLIQDDIDLMSEGYHPDDPETETETEERQRQSKKKPSKKFTPPTVDEVREYCQQRQNNVDPESFIAHYEANGWYRGKSKIKDWKACVITWEKRNAENQRTNQQSRKLSLAERATEARKQFERDNPDA